MTYTLKRDYIPNLSVCIKKDLLFVSLFWWRGDKKDIFAFFVWVWTVASQSRQRRVYHQNEVLYITKAKALYIIIAKEDTACGWWYTRFGEICSSKRMRYTLIRDDMPLLSQWIKKFDKSKLVEFFGGDGESRTRVLHRSFTISTYLFRFYPF